MADQTSGDRPDASDNDFAAEAIPGMKATTQVAQQRRHATQQRTRAAQQRTLAADRRKAAEERDEAAHEREHAVADREMLARQSQLADIDIVTGTSTRASGLTNLGHELDRCRRTVGQVVIVYVDVVGLKAINESEGHGAGDQLLRQLVALMKKHLRSYDLIIRMGGDEFLCAVSDITLGNARLRFTAIDHALAQTPGPGAIRCGFAERLLNDTVEDLIARANPRAQGCGSPVG